jgi:chemotaxis protein MotB
VNPHIISAQGFGDSRPVASNDTAQGRAKDRRVEILIMAAGS